MKLKQILTIAFLSASLLQAGFFDHDKEYYDKHLKEAKSKADLCDKAVVTALKEGNMKLAEKYNKDDECVAAKKSLDEYKEKQRKAKYEAEKKKRKEKLAKKKALFDAEYKKYYDSYKKADFDTFYKDERCARVYIDTGDMLVLLDDSKIPLEAKCKAWKDLKKEKDKAQLEYVIKNYQKEDLIKYMDDKCRIAGGDIRKCNIAREAFKKEVEKQKRFYAEHKGLLEKDFKECHDKLWKFREDGNIKEAQKVSNTYKCKMASEVANKDISLSFK